jgi:hypothetical protein
VNHQREAKIEILKNKLDDMVIESNWDSDVDLIFQDHNYYCIQTKTTAKECDLLYMWFCL